MEERRQNERGRTFLGGKISFNNNQSTIDCLVRNVSADGACVQVESPIGLPSHVDLRIAGEAARSSRVVWQSRNRIGLEFDVGENSMSSPTLKQDERVHGELLAMRAALDEVSFGVVLLDNELRAQFINRAFRRMWRLPDAKADSKPAFVALMYHGRDTRAYQVSEHDIDDYIANRMALIKSGTLKPLDLRLASGEVIRLNCAILPNGGRMLSYTYVTDIVRHSDELQVLKDALDHLHEGVVLLDPDLNATFINRAVRELWRIPDELAKSKPHYRRLVSDARFTGTYGVAAEDLDAFIERRVASVKDGNKTPQDMKTGDGRRIRSQCTVLANGGRMLTYSDVTDLFDHAAQLETLASIDSMTGIYNRRQFLALAEAEWARFQRYHRPLSMLMVDIDHFKAVNDCFGHATGDAALAAVAHACQADRRSSDIVGRVGGEEFALLIPETDIQQAGTVAERIRKAVSEGMADVLGGNITLTVSIGIAEANVGMSGVAALMRDADQALYLAKADGRNCVRESRLIQPETQMAAE